jgi:succinate dehydrogenase / fumarate reductase membrane anchor subunit
MTTNRIVVGAHYGLRDWLAQRISAVVLLIYTLVLLGAVVFTSELNYFTWQASLPMSG